MTAPETVKIRVAMNGVTGKMGLRRHLEGAILPIIADGGVRLRDGRAAVPEPILVGRDANKLRRIAADKGLSELSDRLDDVLSDPTVSVYFDAQATGAREAAIRKALGAGKHIYSEKPVALSHDVAREFASIAADRGLCTGIVHDKFGLPGLYKLRQVVKSGMLGENLHIKIEFGYWIFDGFNAPGQRPSWNYRKDSGGGIISDMFPHWRYVLEGLAGPIASVQAVSATSIPRRVDEAGNAYDVTAEDRVFALLTFAGGATGSVSSSWATRPYRDDLIAVQIDGTAGSATAGTQHCRVLPHVSTGRPMWSAPGQDADWLRKDWAPAADQRDLLDPFRYEWEQFLRAVADPSERPFAEDFTSAARDIEFVEKTLIAATTGQRQLLS
jgi:predicted dehydrogenase